MREVRPAARFPHDVAGLVRDMSPRIIQFSGHGNAVKTGPFAGALAFELPDGGIQLPDPMAFIDLLDRKRCPRLQVLLYPSTPPAVCASARPCRCLCPHTHTPPLWPQCVFLNGCGTLRPLGATIFDELPHLTIIGWDSVTEDNGAIAFAKGFYDAIGKSYTTHSCAAGGATALVSFAEVVTPLPHTAPLHVHVVVPPPCACRVALLGRRVSVRVSPCVSADAPPCRCSRPLPSAICLQAYEAGSRAFEEAGCVWGDPKPPGEPPNPLVHGCHGILHNAPAAPGLPRSRAGSLQQQQPPPPPSDRPGPPMPTIQQSTAEERESGGHVAGQHDGGGAPSPGKEAAAALSVRPPAPPIAAPPPSRVASQSPSRVGSEPASPAPSRSGSGRLKPPSQQPSQEEAAPVTAAAPAAAAPAAAAGTDNGVDTGMDTTRTQSFSGHI